MAHLASNELRPRGRSGLGSGALGVLAVSSGSRPDPQQAGAHKATNLRKLIEHHVRSGSAYRSLPASMQAALKKKANCATAAKWDELRRSWMYQLHLPYSYAREMAISQQKFYQLCYTAHLQKKMPYPYHYQRAWISLLGKTPFLYYRDMLTQMLVAERPFDEMPNFTARDCVRLTGVDRTRYIDILNKCKAQVGWKLGRKRRISGQLLPQNPLAVDPLHWYRVRAHDALLSPEKSPQKKMMQQLKDPRLQNCLTKLLSKEMVYRFESDRMRHRKSAVHSPPPPAPQAQSEQSPTSASSSAVVDEADAQHDQPLSTQSSATHPDASLHSSSGQEPSLGAAGDSSADQQASEKETVVTEVVDEPKGDSTDEEQSKLGIADEKGQAGAKEEEQPTSATGGADDKQAGDSPSSAAAKPGHTANQGQAKVAIDMTARLFDLDALRALYGVGLIYFEVPMSTADRILIPPLQGFVMNRLNQDGFEKLMYEIMITVDQRISIRQLADMLHTDVARVKDAVALYCRLGFAHKIFEPHMRKRIMEDPHVHENWTVRGKLFPPAVGVAPPRPRGSISEDSLAGSSPRKAPSTPASASRGRALAFLFDSDLVAFLMMGNISPQIKNYAVTLFEAGKLSDGGLEQFVEKLELIKDTAEFQGDVRNVFTHTMALKQTLVRLMRLAPVHLIRFGSLNNLSTHTLVTMLRANYKALIPTVPCAEFIHLTPSVIGQEPPDVPPMLGPACPEITSVWFKLYLYHSIAAGPVSTLWPTGCVVVRLPQALEPFSSFLLCEWNKEPRLVQGEVAYV